MVKLLFWSIFFYIPYPHLVWLKRLLHKLFNKYINWKFLNITCIRAKIPQKCILPRKQRIQNIFFGKNESCSRVTFIKQMLSNCGDSLGLTVSHFLAGYVKTNHTDSLNIYNATLKRMLPSTENPKQSWVCPNGFM